MYVLLRRRALGLGHRAVDAAALSHRRSARDGAATRSADGRRGSIARRPPGTVGVFITRLAELDAAVQLVERGHAPHLLFGQVGQGQARHADRPRLGRRARIAVDHALRRRPLFDRGQRRTVAAIEHEGLAALGRHDDRRHRPAVLVRIVHQRRLRADVVIPHVLVHGLERPTLLAAGRVQRDHRARDRVLLGRTQRAVVVGGGIAHRHVDQAQRVVADHRAPRVRRARAVGLARRRLGMIVRTLHVPGPDEAAGFRAVAADHARRRPAALAVEHLVVDHHHAVDDRRRRGRGDEARHGLAQAGHHVGLAVVAEVRAGLAGFGVDRDQAHVERGFDDAALAGAALGHHGRFVVAHAAAGRGVRHVGVFDAGIEAPDFLAGRRIEPHEVIGGRAQVQAVADLQRRGLRTPFVELAGRRQVAGAVGPYPLQLADVGRGDLAERRIARGLLVAAVGDPVAGDRRRAARVRGQRPGGNRGRRLGDVVRNEGEHERHREDRGHRRRRRQGLLAAIAQPRQHQRERQPQRGQQPQPRHPTPVARTRFPDRPQHRGGEHAGVPARAGRAFAPQQRSRRQQRRARQHVVPGAAERGQITAASEQHEAEQEHRDRDQPQGPGIACQEVELGSHTLSSGLNA